MKCKIFTVLITVILTTLSLTTHAANWSKTQLHINRGVFDHPFTKQKAMTDVISLQHASTNNYGSVFFFVDYLDDDVVDGFNDKDFYSEGYATFSGKALFDWQYNFWRLKDIGFVIGYNAAGDAKVLKYLPGIKLSWDIPGFDFLTTTATAYFDDSAGIRQGGAPQTNNTFMLDLAWGYPYSLGAQKFYFTGHAEYIGSRRNEIGVYINDWILAQMAFQWDLGHAIATTSNTLLLGVEWQVWRNKMGTSHNESATQLHIVWTF
ncbi:hypothetical protein PA25_20600 [Pseudoalteromonas sp. A25]|uniref:nucleoside-binding protein n=1 Tax=Pseudoalteromonas sp. A25 TaxID=116092 RepID=UPI001260A114|nr:nucleoside-binding protein [Pseudoalteromonas sp. A25]BBN82075.1 hypothetical protein PA25_20600 [Pseudoalteromonas sp. A25]